ncbi:Uncharacterised protein [BD1-7 clade bacterium]|uniref:Uncharacterized protein n=1 Tax=BD1-7 clade bacterium TaxID=2029982 RepID=A0A5S9QD84_9GAMM|nr:Uncharacterised protein [BD1-7 clade bacterium]CAA0116312.1 Uncharacterised protein [BD1-7 clade bacterium]
MSHVMSQVMPQSAPSPLHQSGWLHALQSVIQDMAQSIAQHTPAIDNTSIEQPKRATSNNDGFQQVTHSSFQDIVRTFGGSKIKNRQTATYLYDNRNNVVAILKAPAIDRYGRCQPVRYFVRAA